MTENQDSTEEGDQCEPINDKKEEGEDKGENEKARQIFVPEVHVVEAYDLDTPSTFLHPSHYIKWAERTDLEYFDLIEYELDDEDDRFLVELHRVSRALKIKHENHNKTKKRGPSGMVAAKKKKKKKKKKVEEVDNTFCLTELEFATVMDLLEKESFALRYFNPAASHKSPSGLFFFPCPFFFFFLSFLFFFVANSKF